MPKCECGKKIRWIDILNPFKTSYKVDVVDEGGKVINSFRVCDDCSVFYINLVKIINILGEKEVIKLFRGVKDYKKTMD